MKLIPAGTAQTEAESNLLQAESEGGGWRQMSSNRLRSFPETGDWRRCRLPLAFRSSQRRSAADSAVTADVAVTSFLPVTFSTRLSTARQLMLNAGRSSENNEPLGDSLHGHQADLGRRWLPGPVSDSISVIYTGCSWPIEPNRGQSRLL